MRLFLTLSISVLMAILFVFYFGASGIFCAAEYIILGSIALIIFQTIEKKKLLKILLVDLKFFGTHSFMGEFYSTNFYREAWNKLKIKRAKKYFFALFLVVFSFYFLIISYIKLLNFYERMY